MGAEHVGIGSDFDGVREEERVPGIEDVARLPRLIEALEGRGFSSEEVDMIAGDNLMRVFSRVVG